MKLTYHDKDVCKVPLPYDYSAIQAHVASCDKDHPNVFFGKFTHWDGPREDFIMVFFDRAGMPNATGTILKRDDTSDLP
jgi:hypothetical protein